MKHRISVWWEALTGAVLSLLGFSGCEAINNIIEHPAEYGMPHANYKLLGDVSDSKGQPVKGIRVVFAPNGNSAENPWANDTLFTDDKGHFERDHAKFDFGWLDDNVTFLAEDIDGEENGSFKSKELVGKDHITVTKMKEGDGKWYTGDFEISAKITLEENAE